MKRRYHREQHKTSAPVPEPKVGIFWVLDGKLLIDSTPLSGAEPYGDFKVHPGDHCSVWARLQQTGVVPAEMEYEEAPRGRVMYNLKLGQYTFLADRCILRRKELVSRIKSELRLPTNITVGTDSHYRCFTCLYGRDDDED